MTTAVWKRVICHVDMDAFFAAIEQLRNPELRGKPVIVGADPRGGQGRGVVSTASYEARLFGVHSAMPISQAYRLCPQGIYVPPNAKLYSEYSQKIVSILERFTPIVQKVSIDEAFLDVSGHPLIRREGRDTAAVRRLGGEMKDQIFRESGLTASIGISISKSVAKIASDFQKPDGLTVVEPLRVQEFLDPLPVTRLWGVGQKTFDGLSRLGIQTVKQLREFPPAVLEKNFGKWGPHLQRMAAGIDDREVVEREEIKSVSHETTFYEDVTDRELLVSTLLFLAEKVSSRLRKYRLLGKTIQIKLRFEDFSTFTRHKTISRHTQLTEEIFTNSLRLFERFKEEQKPVRLIGVGVSQLIAEGDFQLSFLEGQNERKLQLEKIMDELQQKYGREGLTHARTLAAKKPKSPPPKRRGTQRNDEENLR